MKARVPTYNPTVTRAMKAEIARQGRAFSKDIQTMLMWTLHKHYGFGKKRLELFYITFLREYEDMCRFFETDEVFPAEYKLREIGIDVDELQKKYDSIVKAEFKNERRNGNGL